MIGFKLNHDMGPFVGKTNEKQRIEIVNSEIPHTFIEVEWTISITNQKKEEAEQLASSQTKRKGTEVNRNTMSVAKLQELSLDSSEVKEAIEAKEQLKKDLKALKVNMDLVLAAKQEVEEKYNAEKKLRLQVEAQYKEVKDDDAKQPDVPADLAEKLSSLKLTNDTLRDEIKTLEQELKQKQTLASNLENEATSL